MFAAPMLPPPSLAEAQARVLRALLPGAAAAPGPIDADDADAASSLLLDGPGLPAARRLRIHRHNIADNLEAALAAIYPVLRRLVGDAFFSQTARSYIRAHPPRSAALIDFGGRLAHHLHGLDALAGLPYLADVAALEWALHAVYHAAELQAAELAALAALPPEQAASLRLRLQPCARLLRSRYPVLAIWRANQATATEGAAEVSDAGEAISLDAGGVRLLVAQRALDIELRPLGSAEFRWLRLLSRGCTLADATAAALATDPAFDLAATLARHFADGLFRGDAADRN